MVLLSGGAMRLDSRYEPGMRSGEWMKMRVNRGQEFVVGGYTIGTNTFDALVCGVYEDKELTDVARTRNGFTPATRVALFTSSKALRSIDAPSRISRSERAAAGDRA
jgi:ATP-dependent DNA ligase